MTPVRELTRREPQISSRSGTFLNSAAFRCFIIVWFASLAFLARSDRNSCLLGIGGAVFASLLSWLTVRLVRSRPEPMVDTLCFPSVGPRRTRREVVVFVSFIWVLIYGWAYGGSIPGAEWMRIPFLTVFVRSVYHTPTPFHDSAAPFFQFVTLAVVPFLCLLSTGVKPPSLGLVRPGRGSITATLACISLALVFAIVGLMKGKLTLAAFGWLLLHNFFNNGFTEEFFARGMVMSVLRSRLDDNWALTGQALIFAAGHFGGTMAEPLAHGNPAVALANNFVLNAPMGLALGVMAFRSRSLFQSTIVHMFLDTMTRTL